MSFAALCERYLCHLAVTRGLSVHTVDSYRRDLRALANFLAERQVVAAAQVEAGHLAAYGAYMVATLGAAVASQRRAISSIRQLFLFALREHLIEHNPARGLVAPPAVRTVPVVPSVAEAARLIDSLAKDGSPRGLRDRCALELLYSCGLRASELCQLTLSDLDLATGWLQLPHHTSGRRSVPLGQAARQALTAYLAHGRPALCRATRHPQLLVSNAGQPMTRMVLFAMVKKHGAQAGLGQSVSPHTLRHAFALHLLDNGADLRAVQEMLGHKSVATTEVYLQAGAIGLQNTIDAHHPLSHGPARTTAWEQPAEEAVLGPQGAKD